MKNLFAACLFILLVLSAFCKSTYASGQQDLEFCLDEIELQYVEGEKKIDTKLIEELIKECHFESEVEYVKNTQAIESN